MPLITTLANGSARGYGGLLAAGATSSYESIATATATGVETQLTFSSIPSTYKHLQIRGIARYSVTGGTDDNLYMRFNGDTGSNYPTHWIDGNGSTVSAASIAPWDRMLIGKITAGSSGANMFGACVIDIHDYASTTKNKTVRHIAGDDMNGSGDIWLGSDLWINTSAINQITMFCSGIFAAGSTFALYGIKGA